ncbi:response regulator receiver protein [Novosphingobium sp. Rr 2-17]|uniref:response regulator transcription factor n=1 Tax=Novosphingobium sp. Rr 2-17 TaxID=555793 RepID=UPI0002699205|nr:response regulator [Novosphingobium sp. Rr 2-17]EIZ78687.1 response regulator receiver protein [Novosphingobium sp. Rr 2-17]
MTTRSIYVVDDDLPVRTALQSLLSTLPNLMVFGYRTGDDFLAEIETLGPGCILLDYDMPGRNGLSVLREISQLAPKFGAIILTGQGATSIAVQAWKLGALDFLEKPCDPNTLFEVVDRAFSTIERDHMTASVAENARNAIASLSARERDVLTGLIEGRANKVIAYDLNLSPRTVEIYRANLMDKLNVRSLSEALRIAFAAGLIPMN